MAEEFFPEERETYTPLPRMMMVSGKEYDARVVVSVLGYKDLMRGTTPIHSSMKGQMHLLGEWFQELVHILGSQGREPWEIKRTQEDVRLVAEVLSKSTGGREKEIYPPYTSLLEESENWLSQKGFYHSLQKLVRWENIPQKVEAFPTVFGSYAGITAIEQEKGEEVCVRVHYSTIEDPAKALSRFYEHPPKHHPLAFILGHEYVEALIYAEGGYRYQWFEPRVKEGIIDLVLSETGLFGRVKQLSQAAFDLMPLKHQLLGKGLQDIFKFCYEKGVKPQPKGERDL